MQQKALYRKYRPRIFKDIVGQNSVVKILNNAVLEEKVSHAYLFSGPRGSGKTSMAKILAKKVNCLNKNENKENCKCEICLQIENDSVSDVIEIDAASNNGVDEIRELRNKINLQPSYCKYKIYIIDEVHMLSGSAFNALLKTLEEPPSHVIFILATTEGYKVPLTIVSRCQKFDFKRISENDIVYKLKEIATKEKMVAEKDVLDYIAYCSDGSLRDAIGLLDQVNSLSEEKIELADVLEVVGSISKEKIRNLVESVFRCDRNEILKVSNEINDSGKDYYKITEEIMFYLKDVVVEKISESEMANNKNIHLPENTNIYKLIYKMNNLLKEFEQSNYKKMLFEVTFLEYVDYLLCESEKNKETVVINVEDKTIDKKNTKRMKTDVGKIPELTELRMNNVFATADKKMLEFFKREWNKINEFCLNKETCSLAGWLLDAEVKAASEKCVVLTFPYQNTVDKVNKFLYDVEKIIEKIYKKPIEVVVISNKKWETEKNEYIKQTKDGKKYEIKNNTIEYYFETEEEMGKEENEIIDMFEDIIEIK